MKQPWERWGELDETLSDADARSESGHDMPEDREARQWLLEQRMVHGLLRTLHTADAEAREAVGGDHSARERARHVRTAGAGTGGRVARPARARPESRSRP